MRHREAQEEGKKLSAVAQDDAPHLHALSGCNLDLGKGSSQLAWKGWSWVMNEIPPSLPMCPLRLLWSKVRVHTGSQLSYVPRRLREHGKPTRCGEEGVQKHHCVTSGHTGKLKAEGMLNAPIRTAATTAGRVIPRYMRIQDTKKPLVKFKLTL